MQTRLTITDPLTRCKVITAAILTVGFVSAVIVYLTAVDASNDPLAEFETSKKFAYELERVGGKAAVAADNFNKWFAGLWQGETLAYTVAVITVFIAAGYYFIATSLEDEARHDGNSSAPPSE